MALKRLKIRDSQLSNTIHSPPHPQGLAVGERKGKWSSCCTQGNKTISPVKKCVEIMLETFLGSLDF
jgi:hypothetical protein